MGIRTNVYRLLLGLCCFSTLGAIASPLIDSTTHTEQLARFPGSSMFYTLYMALSPVIELLVTIKRYKLLLNLRVMMLWWLQRWFLGSMAGWDLLLASLLWKLALVPLIPRKLALGEGAFRLVSVQGLLSLLSEVEMSSAMGIYFLSRGGGQPRTIAIGCVWGDY